ncbi:MAG: ribosome recycling factor [Anaerolineales bacterium]
MIRDILSEAESKMKSTLHVLEEDLSKIRTGRASPGLVEKMPIEYYGTPTPLNQLANISVPDAHTIAIRPYDQSTLANIERAIQASDIGLSPNNDGQIIRLNIPPLTQERRKEIVKQVHKRIEEARVSVRNIRRSAIDTIREFEKEKEFTEDESHAGQDDVQKLTDKYIEKVEEASKQKEKEIMDF